MPPAARVGDPTNHGTPLSPGPGSANVIIGGMPAWRAGTDTHSCPLASHVGGKVTLGSVTVLVNGSGAVRQGDSIVEAGPPNTIVAGCPTVLIG